MVSPFMGVSACQQTRYHWPATCSLNTFRPKWPMLADVIFKRIMFKKNSWISIQISLKFVPKGPINSIPVLVQKMVWRCSGARPLSELILVIFQTHICVIWPQWVERQPATENRDGHGHLRWQGNGTVLGERKTHTKAKYAVTKI